MIVDVGVGFPRNRNTFENASLGRKSCRSVGGVPSLAQSRLSTDATVGGQQQAIFSHLTLVDDAFLRV